jgi:1-acyl-sn-glycerol-3-phosphate acyltransferase
MALYFQRIYHWVMWNVLSRIFVEGWLRPLYRFSLAPGSDPVPRPPFLVVSNHNTFFDPWIVGAYSWHPFNIMCNDDAFRASRVTTWYLESIGAFPKKKGAVDVTALKETMRRLRRGNAVCIFPEGQTSWDGETQLIHRGIEKIARQAKCAVLMARIRGNFLTRPWWARTGRTGRIVVTLQTVGAREVASLGDEALFEKIKTHIYQNDVKDPRNREVRFAGTRLAEGLERFVWICMHCGAEDTLAMSGDSITCSSCRSTWTMDAHCCLAAGSPDTRCLADLKDWSDEHRARVLATVSATGPDDLLTRSGDVMMQMNPGTGFADRGAGTLRLTKSTLAFTPGAPGGQPLSFPVGTIRDCVVQKKDLFELRAGDTLYRFRFDHRSPMKWVYYIRYLTGYDRFESQGFIG